MAAKTGIYSLNHVKPLAVTVAKENKDGTVDLAGADGKVFVKCCPVSDEPKHGHFTSSDAVEEAQAETKTETEPKK